MDGSYGMSRPPHMSPDVLMILMDKFVSNQVRVERALGRAAFAAGVLARTKARNVRSKDFRNVQVRPPALNPFSEEERRLIEEYSRFVVTRFADPSSSVPHFSCGMTTPFHVPIVHIEPSSFITSS
jgi:hypothetical protein